MRRLNLKEEAAFIWMDMFLFILSHDVDIFGEKYLSSTFIVPGTMLMCLEEPAGHISLPEVFRESDLYDNVVALWWPLLTLSFKIPQLPWSRNENVSWSMIWILIQWRRFGDYFVKCLLLACHGLVNLLIVILLCHSTDPWGALPILEFQSQKRSSMTTLYLQWANQFWIQSTMPP